ncbi:MAG: L,D-transpeptidase family protein [Rickettsiales bacterium]
MIIVTRKPSVIFTGNEYPCAIGKNGFAEPGEKREGDYKTPVGTFPLREVYYRADRIAKPVTALPLHEITVESGWCDDPAHPDYNKFVKLPFAASREAMLRDDHCYDLVLVIGYNDAPVVPGLGSAIFLHVAKHGFLPTEGCVALQLEHVKEIVATIKLDDTIQIG